MFSNQRSTFSTILGEFSGIALFAMQEYFKYNPTMLYITEEKAVALLTPHDRKAQSIARMELQDMLNEILISEMHEYGVKLLLRFCIVGPGGQHEKPVIPERLPEFFGEKIPDCDPNVVQQVWAEKDNWFEMFGRRYKRPAPVLI